MWKVLKAILGDMPDVYTCSECGHVWMRGGRMCECPSPASLVDVEGLVRWVEGPFKSACEAGRNYPESGHVTLWVYQEGALIMADYATMQEALIGISERRQRA